MNPFTEIFVISASTMDMKATGTSSSAIVLMTWAAFSAAHAWDDSIRTMSGWRMFSRTLPRAMNSGENTDRGQRRQPCHYHVPAPA